MFLDAYGALWPNLWGIYYPYLLFHFIHALSCLNARSLHLSYYWWITRIVCRPIFGIFRELTHRKHFRWRTDRMSPLILHFTFAPLTHAVSFAPIPTLATCAPSVVHGSAARGAVGAQLRLVATGAHSERWGGRGGSMCRLPVCVHMWADVGWDVEVARVWLWREAACLIVPISESRTGLCRKVALPESEDKRVKRRRWATGGSWSDSEYGSWLTMEPFDVDSTRFQRTR